MTNFLYNHTSKETAYEIKDYPYGRLRTSMFVWIETQPKKGDRVCRQTINPKNGRLNAPKCSTYANLMFLYLSDIGHVQTAQATIYTKADALKSFVEAFGASNLNEEQQKQFRQLSGEILTTSNEFTGEKVKDYAVKWERRRDGTYSEVRITFDRPDGVKLGEIFAAIKKLNKEKLAQVFTVVESRHFGPYTGIVRICTRGGAQLGAVSAEEYNEFLASDQNQVTEAQ